MMVAMGELILLRHGETEWSRAGRHTGRTDIPLTPAGEAAAASLAPALAGRDIAAVFTSPAQRAVRTAELAGLDGAKPDPDLQEWDYGGYEGMHHGADPGGPSWLVPLARRRGARGCGSTPGRPSRQVGARADAVLARVRPLLRQGDVVLVSHAHLLRVLTARWLGLEPAGGRLFRLDTGTLSTLGSEHDYPVILTWNVPVSAAGSPPPSS